MFSMFVSGFCAGIAVSGAVAGFMGIALLCTALAILNLMFALGGETKKGGTQEG